MKDKIFKGPGDVLKKITEDGIEIPTTEALIRKNEYVVIQNKWQKMLAPELASKESLPPCCKCPPTVFCYCEDKGTECAVFEKHSCTGKSQK